MRRAVLVDEATDLLIELSVFGRSAPEEAVRRRLQDVELLAGTRGRPEYRGAMRQLSESRTSRVPLANNVGGKLLTTSSRTIGKTYGSSEVVAAGIEQ